MGGGVKRRDGVRGGRGGLEGKGEGKGEERRKSLGNSGSGWICQHLSLILGQMRS